MKNQEIEENIKNTALKLLSGCIDDYDTAVWNKISKDVIECVMTSPVPVAPELFSEADISRAIGRALVKNLA